MADQNHKTEKQFEEQIKEKSYHLKYQNEGKDIYLIGIDFDSGERNVAGFEWEKV